MIFRERWKDIAGYEGRYQVSDYGKVRGMSWRVTRFRYGKAYYAVMAAFMFVPTISDGYPTIGLTAPDGKRRKFGIHQLVASAFIGPCPEDQEVRHRNGTRLDARLKNLHYGTRKQNLADRFLHGTHPTGMNNARSIFIDEQILEMRRRRSNGEGVRALAREYGINSGHMSHILNGKLWKHL